MEIRGERAALWRPGPVAGAAAFPLKQSRPCPNGAAVTNNSVIDRPAHDLEAIKTHRVTLKLNRTRSSEHGAALEGYRGASGGLENQGCVRFRLDSALICETDRKSV